MIHTRRSFLAGFAGILAAPAIVRASSLMPVRQPANDVVTVTFGDEYCVNGLIQIRAGAIPTLLKGGGAEIDGILLSPGEVVLVRGESGAYSIAS